MRRTTAAGALLLLAAVLLRPSPTPEVVAGRRPSPGAAFSRSEPSSTTLERTSNESGVREYSWAADEIRLGLKADVRIEDLLPGARILEHHGLEVTLLLASKSKAEFVAEAARLTSLSAVEHAQPVYYASERSRKDRRGPRLYLTRDVLVTLTPGVDPRVVALRRGARYLRSLPFIPGAHVFEAPDLLGAPALAADLVAIERATSATPQFAMMPRVGASTRASVNDPNFGNQWHLLNGGQGGGLPGEDVRAEGAWDITLGSGAVVGILDTGIQYVHPDLSPNLFLTTPGGQSLGWDFNSNDNDPAPVTASERHGTAVVGVAAARGNNSLGVSGAAPLAKFVPIRLVSGAISDATIASAMAYENGTIQIKTNSWSFAGSGTLDPFGHSADAAAIANGFAGGRGGRGVVYLFAGGNSGFTSTDPLDVGVNDNVNYNGYATLRQVITVGATTNTGVRSDYSTPGAALLVCAPSNGGTLGIETTDRTGTAGYNTSAGTAGDYTGTNQNGSAFGGTSSAAPLVAGVVALMLSAEPQMSSRDVQHVLVRTARRIDPGSLSWVQNQNQKFVSHDYGHGVVDAGAAVALSRTMPFCGPEVQVTATSAGGDLAIPDSPGAPASGGSVSKTVTLPAAGAIRVEHVEVVFSAKHPRRGDLRVRLLHAGTAFSDVLADMRAQDEDADYSGWRFMSTLHWGESSAGDWTIEVADLRDGEVGTLGDFTLRVYGTAIDTSPPVAGSVNDGAAADLDVQFSTTTINANWSGFSDPQSGLSYEWWIGTTPGGSDVMGPSSVGHATSASAGGLTLVGGSTIYYVTVRATNFDGLQSSSSSNGVHLNFVVPRGIGFDGPQALQDWTLTGSAASPRWDVDATPSLVAGIGLPYHTGPFSLNYNNGVDLAAPASVSSGVATSPVLDRSALASGWIRFWCNDDTDAVNDVRSFRVMSGDLTTVLSNNTMSRTVAPAAGICAAKGIWHEHALPLNGLTTFAARFSYSTGAGLGHPGAGWFVDDLEISDQVVGALHQYPAGALTPIPEGGATTSFSIEFRGVGSIVAPSATQLEIEVQPVGTAFTGTATASGNGAGPGAIVSVPVVVPALGAYRWRARSRTLPAGTFSGWMEFGSNAAADADFSVVAPRKKGHGGGCGATGLEALPLLGLLRLVRKRRSARTKRA